MIGIENMRVILASASPRRRELLKLVTENFEIIPSNSEEIAPHGMDIFSLPQYLAELKAKSAAEDLNGEYLVVGSDTCVILGGEVMGKPKNIDDARRMLKSLSGKEHFVVTGCCLITPQNTVSFSEKTSVTFYELSDDDIEEYISTGEPFDKAGAYGIQEKGAMLVEKICGDYNNVVGLPVARLKREMAKCLENLAKTQFEPIDK